MKPLLIALGISLVILSAGVGYRSYLFEQSLAVTARTATQAQKLAALIQQTLESRVTRLEADLQQAKNEGFILDAALQAKTQEVDAIAGQVSTISATVGILDKLSKSDPKLLQKYSKVYFLNENYVPGTLTLIDKQYVASPDKPEQIHTGAWPFLQQLLAAAATNGTELKIISGYRSFGTQAALKSTYSVTYGSGANKFSADQGYSEHQLGTAVDLTTPALGLSFEKFASAPAYQWLQENAHRYGFVLSYPKDNSYYVFEPWHWRFVGIGLATKLHNEGKQFYDLDQKTIDAYLVSMFDPT